MQHHIASGMPLTADVLNAATAHSRASVLPTSRITEDPIPVWFAKVTAIKNEAGSAWTNYKTDGFVHHVYANPSNNSVGTAVDTGATLYLLATPRQDTATIGFADIAVNDIVAYIPIPATVAVPTVSGKYFTGQVVEHVGATGGFQCAMMGVLFPVTLAQTGGADGTNAAAATWTYTVTDVRQSVELGTSVDPTASPHKWVRDIGPMAKATAGLAYWSSPGTFVLTWLNELPSSELCA